MNKNVYFTIDYMCKPAYSGESFKDAMLCFRSYFGKYASMIEADYVFYYNDNLAALGMTRIGYPQPIGARLVFGKKNGLKLVDFTANQRMQIAANVNTLCRDYGLALQSDILFRMYQDA